MERTKTHVEEIMISLIKKGYVISYTKRQHGYWVGYGAHNTLLPDIDSVEAFLMGFKCAVGGK
jgi:hypothetical protein